MLSNKSVAIEKDGARFWLGGVEDVLAGRADVPGTLRGIPGEEAVVLMAHEPDYADYVAGYPVDLQLSGHTHGGQVIVPIEGTRYAPVKDKRYIAGLKPWGARQIHVTRGVGNVGGVRFRCRPEVSTLVVA